MLRRFENCAAPVVLIVAALILYAVFSGGRARAPKHADAGHR